MLNGIISQLPGKLLPGINISHVDMSNAITLIQKVAKFHFYRTLDQRFCQEQLF